MITRFLTLDSAYREANGGTTSTRGFDPEQSRTSLAGREMPFDGYPAAVVARWCGPGTDHPPRTSFRRGAWRTRAPVRRRASFRWELTVEITAATIEPGSVSAVCGCGTVKRIAAPVPLVYFGLPDRGDMCERIAQRARADENLRTTHETVPCPNTVWFRPLVPSCREARSCDRGRTVCGCVADTDNGIAVRVRGS